MVNFSIDNVVGKPIINKGLFYVFNSLRKIVREEDITLALEIYAFMIALL